MCTNNIYSQKGFRKNYLFRLAKAKKCCPMLFMAVRTMASKFLYWSLAPLKIKIWYWRLCTQMRNSSYWNSSILIWIIFYLVLINSWKYKINENIVVEIFCIETTDFKWKKIKVLLNYTYTYNSFLFTTTLYSFIFAFKAVRTAYAYTYL